MRLPWPIILASGSPRREQLLRTLVTDFEIKVTHVEEGLLPNERLEEATQRLAIKKARSLSDSYSESLIVSADTLVGLESGPTTFILEKPSDPAHAQTMLASLSGRTHAVVTGVALLLNGTETVFSERTAVTFRTLSGQEIREYVAGGEPLDKAGAYGIQGGAAGFVKRIEGSLNNVVGLPTERLELEFARLLSQFG